MSVFGVVITIIVVTLAFLAHLYAVYSLNNREGSKSKFVRMLTFSLVADMIFMIMKTITVIVIENGQTNNVLTLKVIYTFLFYLGGISNSQSLFERAEIFKQTVENYPLRALRIIKICWPIWGIVTLVVAEVDYFVPEMALITVIVLPLFWLSLVVLEIIFATKMLFWTLKIRSTAPSSANSESSKISKWRLILPYVMLAILDAGAIICYIIGGLLDNDWWVTAAELCIPLHGIFCFVMLRLFKEIMSSTKSNTTAGLSKINKK